MWESIPRGLFRAGDSVGHRVSGRSAIVLGYHKEMPPGVPQQVCLTRDFSSVDPCSSFLEFESALRLLVPAPRRIDRITPTVEVEVFPAPGSGSITTCDADRMLAEKPDDATLGELAVQYPAPWKWEKTTPPWRWNLRASNGACVVEGCLISPIGVPSQNEARQILAASKSLYLAAKPFVEYIKNQESDWLTSDREWARRRRALCRAVELAENAES